MRWWWSWQVGGTFSLISSSLKHDFGVLWCVSLPMSVSWHSWVSCSGETPVLGYEKQKKGQKIFFLTQKCGCFLFLPPSLKYNLNSTIFVNLWWGDLSPRIQQNPLTITSTSFFHYPGNISSISGAASWTEKRSSIKERIHHQQSWRTKFETRTDSLGTLNEGMKDWQLSFTHTGDFVITGNSLHMFTTQLNCCIYVGYAECIELNQGVLLDWIIVVTVQGGCRYSIGAVSFSLLLLESGSFISC